MCFLNLCSPLFEAVHLHPFPPPGEVAGEDPAELVPVQEVVRHAEQVLDGAVQPRPAVAEQVQAQLQPHAGVPLVIGELDVGHDLLQNIQRLVLLTLGLRLDNIRQNLPQTCGSFGNLSVANL